MPLSGGALEPMVQFDPAAKGLLVLGTNLWWTQPNADWTVTVNKTKRNNACCSLTAVTSQPGADLLATAGSNMYWANLGATPYLIQWAGAAESVGKKVATAPTKPVSLVTDATTVYWADGVDTVWSAPADGSVPAAVKFATGLSQPGAMALTFKNVVILERGSGAIVVRRR